MRFNMMDENEIKQRDRIVEIARQWVGTPYHHMAMVKGSRGGCDCATLLCAVYAEAGLVEQIKLDYYPSDWALHRNEERYLRTIMKYGRRVDTPRRGDIALYKFGRVVSHSAIVVDFPAVIHCVPDGVIEDFDGSGRLPSHRRIGFYSLWGGE